METLSTVHMQREQWSQANETEEGGREREEQATLCGGEVWLAVPTAEASGELRDGFLPANGGATVVDNDSRQLLWRRRGR